jgi:hypothetical protein
MYVHRAFCLHFHRSEVGVLKNVLARFCAAARLLKVHNAHIRRNLSIGSAYKAPVAASDTSEKFLLLTGSTKIALISVVLKHICFINCYYLAIS